MEVLVDNWTSRQEAWEGVLDEDVDEAIHCIELTPGREAVGETVRETEGGSQARALRNNVSISEGNIVFLWIAELFI